jgi:hypothetical protein
MVKTVKIFEKYYLLALCSWGRLETEKLGLYYGILHPG